MLIREGIKIYGHYSGGEWCERETHIEANGVTLEELDVDVERLTKLHSSEGSKIDFGYIDGTSTVRWEDDIYEKNKVEYRSEVQEYHVVIPRTHTILVQNDSSLSGTNTWMAKTNHTSVYGATEQEAIDKLVESITEEHIDG